MTPRTSILMLSVLAALGCTQEKRLGLGEGCSLNTDCDTPLVCRLTACRTECVTARDCPIGLQCVLDERDLGVCQLEAEASCALQSDCPAPLVCRSSTCVNECRADEDCPQAARCFAEDGTTCMGATGCGCFDPAGVPCQRSSECAQAGPMGTRWFCGLDSRCAAQCESSRDCRAGSRCTAGLCALPDAGVVIPDGGGDGGGVLDGGLDGAVGDGGPDGGPPDGAVVRDGGVDGGVDAGTDAGGGPPPCPGMGTAVGTPAAGGSSSCTILASGQVYCWGRNDQGQLGLGYFSPRVGAPRRVVGLTDARAVSVGSSHACAVRATGTAVCWGSTLLGDGSTASSARPVPVSGLTSVAEIIAGGLVTCARTMAGAIFCWGRATDGGLGDGRSSGESATPQMLVASGATALTYGGRTGCYLDGTGTAQCWGRNASGQLGDGTRTARLTPAPLTGLPRITQIAQGDTGHACAVVTGGMLFCWGENMFGEAGQLAGMDVLTPMPVPDPMLMMVSEVRAGGRATCARMMGGLDFCWGDNSNGVRGDGTPMTGPMVSGPVNFPTLMADSPVSLAGHACARVGSDVYCWGNNFDGQLGDGTTIPRNNPIRVECLP